jgi:hypothetical protein
LLTLSGEPDSRPKAEKPRCCALALIFANIGLGLTIAGQPIVDQNIFSAVVIMVILTTMVTPPALKWSLAR